MPEFTYTEVQAEYTRLGYEYPSDADFTEDAINEAIGKLPDYSLSTELARLNGDRHAPAVVTAFTSLAKALGAAISVQYGSLSISRDTTPEERRQSALNTLKTRRNEEFRNVATRSLEAGLEERVR